MLIPSSKSQTLRAILFAALAEGNSIIELPLTSPDTRAMINAVRLLGANVVEESDRLIVTGCGGIFKPVENVIDCGNSGLVLRLVGALAGLIPQYTVLTGDASIRKRRPAGPLLDGLMQLGAFAVSSKGDGHAPLIIKGPVTKSSATISGEDSQPISGLLIAAAFAPHPIELHVVNPGETPWVDLTLDWFRRLNIPFYAANYRHYRMEGSAKIPPFTYRVPGDFSTAAFPIAAALATDSEKTFHNIDFNDPQGDKALIFLLQEMGAQLEIDRKNKTVTVKKGSRLQGRVIDVNDFIDALPILAVIGTFAKGTTTLYNGKIARSKESDRIAAIVTELKKMGAKIEEREDGLVVHESTLVGTEVHSHFDHRIALSLSVAALRARGETTLVGSSCIEKTYPNFSGWKR